MIASSKPKEDKISKLCSPNLGAGLESSLGVLLNLAAGLACLTSPKPSMLTLKIDSFARI